MSNTDSWYITDDERNWQIIRAMEKEIVQARRPVSGLTTVKGGQQVNSYEKQVGRAFLTIEYGAGATIEQLVMAEAYFQVIADRIKANGHDVPKELDTILRATSNDLREKLRADRLKQIKAMEIQLESLMSAEDKRANLQEQLAKLKELVK